MEQLKTMKEMLVSCVQGQMSHLDSVDAKELGEAIDMIKDLSEAIYYCTVTEAMEGKEPVGGQRETMYYPVMYYNERGGNTDGRDGGRRNYSDPMMYPYYDNRDMDWQKGRMYYDGNGTSSNGSGGGSSSNNSGTRNYSERDLAPIMRDQREGRSPMSRKMYMESKEMHKDKTAQMHELEKYAQELTNDMVEMIENASPEEKQFLSNKIAALATKIK